MRPVAIAISVLPTCGIETPCGAAFEVVVRESDPGINDVGECTCTSRAVVDVAACSTSTGGDTTESPRGTILWFLLAVKLFKTAGWPYESLMRWCASCSLAPPREPQGEPSIPQLYPHQKPQRSP